MIDHKITLFVLKIISDRKDAPPLALGYQGLLNLARPPGLGNILATICLALLTIYSKN